MAEPVLDSFYDSTFELRNSISDLDVDFELTFEDLYFPSENEAFFVPVDATKLEAADCVVVEVSEATIASSSTTTSKVVVDRKCEVEEEATTYKKTSTRKRKNETEEDRSKRYNKYRRLDEDGGASDDEEKRNARLVRNRESALLSRQRKKHYVEELEDKVKSLQSVINDMNSKVSFFMSENATLRQTVGPGGKGMCWPGSGLMYPMPPYPCMPFPAYQGSHRVVPLLPIPRLKPQRSLAKVKKTEAKKTMKVASVSVLGLLFCLFLFGALAPIVNVSFIGIRGVFYGEYDQVRGRVLDVFDSSSRGSDQGVGRNVSETENSLPLGNGNEQLLVASLFVPRNEKLVKLDGNLIIHSVLASEKDMASETKRERESSVATSTGISPALPLTNSTRTRDMSKHLNTEKLKALSGGSDDSKDKLNSTTSSGEMQRWFREGVAGPMFSSEMCTEVFQFDVSSTSGAIIPTSPATQQHKNTPSNTNKGNINRRILRGGHPVSSSNLTKDQNSTNKENFSTTKAFPSMVVSVLTDPREEGSDGDMAGGTKSLSRVYIVVLVDGVKYVTYSCVLPRLEEVPHLVTT